MSLNPYSEGIQAAALIAASNVIASQQATLENRKDEQPAHTARRIALLTEAILIALDPKYQP